MLPLVFLMACSSSTSNVEDLIFTKSDYSFSMFDTTGNLLANGVFTITTINGNDVSGSYRFNQGSVQNFPGRESMTGSFSGQLSENQKNLWVNTNPKLSDNNVFMNITAGKFSYLGDWRYSTMRGSLSSGKIQLFVMK